MFKVKLKSMYDTLGAAGIIANTKNYVALVSVLDSEVRISTSDGNKRFIRALPIEDNDWGMTDGAPSDIGRQFVVSLDKVVGILSNYIPRDGIDVSDLEIGFDGEGVMTLHCIHTLSESKYDESIAGTKTNEFSNRITIESVDTPRYSIVAKSKYDDMLEETEEYDEWDIATLRDNLSRLIIDKGTRIVYTSAKRGQMFAVGSNQLSIITTEGIKYGFILDVTTAKAVADTLGKFEGTTVTASTAEGSRYVNFRSADGTTALWAACIPATKSDLSKLDLYTSAANRYAAYRGYCVKDTLIASVDAIMGSDKEDNQKFEIIKDEDGEYIRLSNVSAGGSIGNQFTTRLMSAARDSEEREDLAGTIVIKTLSDIMKNCKNIFVVIGVEVKDEYTLMRFEDRSNDYKVLNSAHYTMINTR